MLNKLLILMSTYFGLVQSYISVSKCLTYSEEEVSKTMDYGEGWGRGQRCGKTFARIPEGPHSF